MMRTIPADGKPAVAPSAFPLNNLLQSSNIDPSYVCP